MTQCHELFLTEPTSARYSISTLTTYSCGTVGMATILYHLSISGYRPPPWGLSARVFSFSTPSSNFTAPQTSKTSLTKYQTFIKQSYCASSSAFGFLVAVGLVGLLVTVALVVCAKTGGMAGRRHASNYQCRCDK